MPFLELRRITKRFGPHTALDDVSLDVAAGEFVVLVGPSGCGKSTLLRIAAGLESPDSGDVMLDGVRVNDHEPRARDVALVFQNYALYPHRTVRGNLAFPLQMAGVPRAEIAQRVSETAELLGLDALLERKPATLSGGQMQRVALGRAIIRRPRLFLFDEPLSNLDAKLRAEMRAEIGRLHRRLGVTTLYVTHDQAEAMTMGTRICVLDAGRVEQIGPPLEVYQRPATSFVAGFIGSPAMNLLRGRVQAGAFRAGPLVLPAPAAREGAELLLGVRPHEARVGGTLELSVTLVEELGSETVVRCALDGQELVVVLNGSLPVRAGERLALDLPSDARHWFDARTRARIAVG
jgi:ABC-type sugar transport system ATPase subunit